MKLGNQLAEMSGVVSVFPNVKRRLHTTHSWSFMGLLDDETLEISGYSTKNQVNIILGFIDTGELSSSPIDTASYFAKKAIPFSLAFFLHCK